MENSGEYAIVKILESRMKSVMGMLRRELNKQILRGDSAVLSAVNTLNGDTGLGSATGFLEHLSPVLPSGQNNVVGGISKATFQVPGWLNQFANAGGALAMTDLYDLYIAANNVAPSGDVSHLIMSNNAFAQYRNLLFAQERFVQTDKLDGGRMALAFNGAVAEADPEMGFASSVAGNCDAYMLNYDGIKLIFHSEGDFAVSPFEHISGTTARAAQLYVKVQLVADHLGGAITVALVMLLEHCWAVSNAAGVAELASAASAQPVVAVLAEVVAPAAGVTLKRVVVRKSF
jgi:hypothetical protein